MTIVESKGVRYFFQSYRKSLRISKNRLGGFLMPEKIYSFNGKDITMNICIQIRDVVKLLQEHFQISFEEAVLRFYKSETYKTLQETENGLWAESAEYIADRYYEETAG